jgi:hypothetical protein
MSTDQTTRYALRLSARNVRGTVQIPHVESLRSARAVAESWRRDLGVQWTVEVVNERGEVQP